MPSDEWDAKARPMARGIINPDSVMRYMSEQDAARWIGDTLREAYQRGRNEADTAAERRGIERAAEAVRAVQRRQNAIAADWASRDLRSSHELFSSRAAGVRMAVDAILALAPPMADAGPTEPAGASDREGT